MHSEHQIREALRDIVEGKIVKRSRHRLMYDGVDVSGMFEEELLAADFRPVTVNEVEIRPGQRVPAFLLKDGEALFGWIFWEKFTELRLRKLFGTVVRNAKGDWLIQIASTSPQKIFARIHQIMEMDIDRPFEWL